MSETPRRLRAGVVLDRKASLQTLGAAALAAATLRAPAASAKKKGGANKRCQSQRGACLLFVRAICDRRTRALTAKAQAPLGTVEECVEELTPCCDLVAQCELGDGLECIVARPVKEPTE